MSHPQPALADMQLLQQHAGALTDAQQPLEHELGAATVTAATSAAAGPPEQDQVPSVVQLQPVDASGASAPTLFMSAVSDPGEAAAGTGMTTQQYEAAVMRQLQLLMDPSGTGQVQVQIPSPPQLAMAGGPSCGDGSIGDGGAAAAAMQGMQPALLMQGLVPAAGLGPDALAGLRLVLAGAGGAEPGGTPHGQDAAAVLAAAVPGLSLAELAAHGVVLPPGLLEVQGVAGPQLGQPVLGEAGGGQPAVGASTAQDGSALDKARTGEPGDSDVADILLAMADSSSSKAAAAAAAANVAVAAAAHPAAQQTQGSGVGPAVPESSAQPVGGAGSALGVPEGEDFPPAKRARLDGEGAEGCVWDANAVGSGGDAAGAGVEAAGVQAPPDVAVASAGVDAGAAAAAAGGGAVMVSAAPDGLVASMQPVEVVDAHTMLQMQQLEQQLQALQQAQMLQLPLISSAQLGGLQLTPEQLQHLQLQFLVQQQAQLQALQHAQLLQLHVAALPGGSAILGGGAGPSVAGGMSKEEAEAEASQHMIRRHGCLPERLITREMLRAVFGLPIEEAAKSLGIGQTMLKHYCRKFGIPRWPYRKRQSVVILMDSIKQFAHERPLNVQPALAKLNTFLEQIDEDPNVDLDGPIKRLRQAFFKEAYKKRVREQQGDCAPDPERSLRTSRNLQRTEVWLENLCNAICEESIGPGPGSGGQHGGGGGEGSGGGEHGDALGSVGGDSGGMAVGMQGGGLVAQEVMQAGLGGIAVSSAQGMVVVNGMQLDQAQQQQLAQLHQLQQLQQVAMMAQGALQPVAVGSLQQSA